MSTTTFSEVRLVPDIITLSSSTLLDEEQRAALIAKRLEALSHPTRLRALRILAGATENSVSVKALTRLLGTSTQGTISKHIGILVLAGFLECVELRGKGLNIRHCYIVKSQAISDALDELLSYTRSGAQGAATG